MTDLMAKIAELAQNQMGVDNPPQPDQSLLEYGFDSLDTIEMVMAVEDEFGIEIDDATADDANTVRKIAELVAARRGGNA